MKKVSKLLIVAVVSTAMIACGGNKKQQNETSDVKTDTLSRGGTYEGVINGSDTPESKMYVLVALKGNGQYEMFQKPIEHVGTYVSKGKLEWNTSKDSVKLVSEKNMQFQVLDNALKSGNITLKRISDNEKLDDVYLSYLVKEDKSGNNYPIKIYREGDVSYAELEIDGKNYKLKENTDNSQEQTFVDGAVSLTWNIIDPAPMADYKPTFFDGKVSHKFTILSPSNVIYYAQKEDAPEKVLDVLYFTHGEGKSFAKLMSADISHCYTLKQTEASAKTADYEADETKWSLNNDHTASLVIGQKEYKYKDKYAKK